MAYLVPSPAFRHEGRQIKVVAGVGIFFGNFPNQGRGAIRGFQVRKPSKKVLEQRASQLYSQPSQYLDDDEDFGVRPTGVTADPIAPSVLTAPTSVSSLDEEVDVICCDDCGSPFGEDFETSRCSCCVEEKNFHITCLIPMEDGELVCRECAEAN